MKISSRHRRIVPAMRPACAAVVTLAAILSFGSAVPPAHAIPETGACCKPDTTCVDLTPDDCSLHSGTYQGSGTVCTEVNCSETTPTTSTTTTSTTTSTSTTMVIKGACCTGTSCFDNETEDYCIGELQGTWHGDASSCDEPGLCVNCGDGCEQYGEACDDGNTQNGDGCDEKCGEEACYKCTVPQADTRTIQPFCFGPAVCFFDEKCGYCGDGVTGPGEQCDEGNTSSTDCCDDDCQYVPAGGDCADGFFCDGAETCDGSGNCVAPQAPVDCSRLDSECAIGVCDPKANACVAATGPKDGDPCESGGSCTVGGSAQCEDGECVGEGTTLSPSCRWIVCAGSSSGDVRLRTGDGSAMDANACGDTAKWAGITTGSLVVGATTGEGAYFYGPPEVEGDIATGGSSLGASLYITVPGTDMKNIAGGQTVAKDPAGSADTTGNHALVDVCNDDQAALTAAIPVLDAMGDPDDEEGGANGLKVPVGQTYTIDVTGQNLAVVDMNGLKLGKGTTLTLRGTASDVVLLRVDGVLKLGYGSQLALDGLVASNVAIYGTGPRCRLSPGVVGEGTMFCPGANRFVVGAGVNWSGTFLGGAREVQVRSNAELTHVAFTGF